MVLMARAGRADRCIGRRERCRSSVVEHPLGKGEVVSSILTGSTTLFACARSVSSLVGHGWFARYRTLILSGAAQFGRSTLTSSKRLPLTSGARKRRSCLASITGMPGLGIVMPRYA